jgi:hypothetical protein
MFYFSPLFAMLQAKGQQFEDMQSWRTTETDAVVISTSGALVSTPPGA